MISPRILLAAVLLSAALAAGAQPPDGVRAAIQRGDIAQALQRLEQHLMEHPDDLPARFLLARLHSRQGRIEEAIAGYEEMLKQHPQTPEIYNNLAALYVSKGNLDQARLILEQGMQTSPAYASLYRNISALYMEMARRSYTEARLLKEEAPPLELEQLEELAERERLPGSP